MITDEEKIKFQNNIKSIKFKLDDITDKAILGTNLCTDLKFYYVAKTFAVRVGSSNLLLDNTYKERNSSSMTIPVSMVNFTNCENKLKNKFELSDQNYFTVKQFDFNPEANIQGSLSKSDVSGSVLVELYDRVNKKKLDVSICNQEKVEYIMPLQSSVQVKLNNIKIFSYSQIDIFDHNSPVFTSRCYRMIEEETKSDITINMRRQNYYSGQIDCSNNCLYKGRINSYSIDCSCMGLQTLETYHTVLNRTLDLYSDINLDIFKCYEAYNRVKILLSHDIIS